MTIGDTIYNTLYKFLVPVVIFVVLVGGGLIAKYIKGYVQKKKSFKLQSLIITPDGNWYLDAWGNYKHGDGIDKLISKATKDTIPVVPVKYIRGGKVILYRYGKGQYAVIPPWVFERIDLKHFNIELVNLQMKNFVYLEQRAAVARWQYVKDLMNRWAPWITLALVCAAICVCIWFMLKTGYNIYDSAVAQRLAECKNILPTYAPPTPAG
jgi:hypothetical protein